MRRTRLTLAGLALLVGFFVAFPGVGSARSDGVCTDLGCVGGETKCADGTMTYPGGQVVNFTCYTTIDPE